MLWHLYSARPMLTRFPMKKAAFCPINWWPSMALKVLPVEKSALISRMTIMPTIIMGKMDMELPLMYMTSRFIGTCLMGPRASSQDFLIIKWLWSPFSATSLWFCPAAGLYPGGDAYSLPFETALEENGDTVRPGDWKMKIGTSGRLPRLHLIAHNSLGRGKVQRPLALLVSTGLGGHF